MPFAPEFDEIYTSVFQPACRARKVECWRVDELGTPGSITSDIVMGILDSELIIADLTGQNANVFYELGIAHALGKSVIAVSQRVQEVPFDLANYRVLPYDTSLSGATRLRDQLEQVIAGLLASADPPGNPVQDAIQLRKRRKGSPASTTNPGAAAPVSHFDARIQEARLEKAVATIVAALKRISGPSGKHLVLSPRDREEIWIRFYFEKKAGEMLAEAVGNRELKRSERLSREKMTKMKELGWSPPDADLPGYFNVWSVRNDHDLRLIALETARVFSEVYQVEELDAIEPEFG